MKEKQIKLFAKAIYDRNFDIPDWMYDYIDDDVIEELALITVYNDERMNIDSNKNNSKIICGYQSGTPVKKFFDRIRNSLNITGVSADIIYMHGDGILSGLLFNKKGWRRVRSIIRSEAESDESKYRFFKILLKYLLSSDELIDYTRMVLKIIGFSKKYVIDMIYSELFIYHDDDKQERLYRLIKVLNINKSYVLTQYCLNLNIPVFFNNGDITDLYQYLTAIEKSNWKCDIDKNITRVKITNEEYETEIYNLIHHIYGDINNSIIIPAKNMIRDEKIFKKLFYDDILTDYTKNKYGKYGIKDFNDLIDYFGHNQYGIPMDAQIKFILNGGEIKTMFNSNWDLLPEASIIKTSDSLNYLISNISVEDLRFIIYNSSDFVKNIFSNKDITQPSYIKILKALFEYPINEELWGVLNKNSYKKGEIDFREIIVRKVTALFTLDNIFLNVPEAMLYIEPSALFVTRNLSADNIQFIPVSKLLPFIPSIISRNEYTKFNRYCCGKYVKLSDIITKDEIAKNIFAYNKYGYLGDMDVDDFKEFMDTYM